MPLDERDMNEIRQVLDKIERERNKASSKAHQNMDVSRELAEWHFGRCDALDEVLTMFNDISRRIGGKQ